jgi:hypothetical protein
MIRHILMKCITKRATTSLESIEEGITGYIQTFGTCLSEEVTLQSLLTVEYVIANKVNNLFYHINTKELCVFGDKKQF